MPELPRLDDVTYDDLVTEARSLIPAYAPEWTDHNPSDPGIALLELFAWLGEMLIYRADQVPDAHRLAFVRLLRGPDWAPPASPDVDAEVGEALRLVRERWRAVTPEDYVAIVPGAAPGRIARVHCAPRRDLAAAPAVDAPGTVSVVIVPALAHEVRIAGDEATEPRVIEEGTSFRLPDDTTRSVWVGATSPFAGLRVALTGSGVGYTLRFQYHDGTQWRGFQADDGTAAMTRSGTIAFSPPAGWAPRPGDDPPRYWMRFSTTTAAATAPIVRRVAPAMPTPDAALVAAVRAHLEPRRILTTRPVVVGPAFVPVGVEALVARTPDADPDELRRAVAARLDAFLDPLTGGPDGTGWPLGRPVYHGELEQLIDGLGGVDHVPDVAASSPSGAGTPLLHPDGDRVGLDVGANRLPDARIDEARIVSAVTFVSVRVRAAVKIADGAQQAAVRAAVKAAVRAFMHPLYGGPSGGAGEWPAADLEARVRAVAGVTQATAELASEPDRVIRDSAGLQVLKLKDGELVDVTTEIAVS
jgi:hypothetical protein